MSFFGIIDKCDDVFLAKKPFTYKNIMLLVDGFLPYEPMEIVAFYLQMGDEFVKKLSGEFRLVLLDGAKVLLVSDHICTKNIYYIDSADFFAFSSNIKELLPLLKSVQLDYDALLGYLSFLTPTPPHTFFKDIKKLPSATMLQKDTNGVSAKRYHNLLDVKIGIYGENEALFLLKKTLKDEVEKRAKKPFASLLSGGVDSASVNYFLKEKNHKTYTLKYKNQAKYDESFFSKKSAEFLGLKHSVIDVSFDDEVLMLFDEPLNDPAIVPLFHMLSGIKNDGYSNIFSGEGGDELFFGYKEYFEFLDIQALTNLKHKNFLKNYFSENFSMKKEWEWYKRVLEGSELFRGSGENFTDLQKNLLLKQAIKDNHSLTLISTQQELFNSSSHTHPSSWYSFLDLELLSSKTKLDTLETILGVQIHTPFLSKEILELSFSIDPAIKLQGPKYLLKKAMQGHLPPELLSRKKKGLSSPFFEHLVQTSKIDSIAKTNKKVAIFKQKELEEFLSLGKKGMFKRHIWGLYVLSIWLDRYF